MSICTLKVHSSMSNFIPFLLHSAASSSLWYFVHEGLLMTRISFRGDGGASQGAAVERLFSICRICSLVITSLLEFKGILSKRAKLIMPNFGRLVPFPLPSSVMNCVSDLTMETGLLAISKPAEAGVAIGDQGLKKQEPHYFQRSLSLP